MDSERLCMELLRAEQEADVLKIVEKTPEMAVPGNWTPLDNRESNFNITSNQASDGGKALTELMTNMVDAVLMKLAYLKKIDPKGKEAPRTMYEAVDTLVQNLQGGKLISADDGWLRDFSRENLIIGITGARTQKQGLPCYTFVDNGEGQNPQDFKKTFLSLSAGHKKDIPFVQGKFNMGSSGVLGYCGFHWFKLIISRRYNRKGEWGWTLMRMRPGARDAMPIAEYFAPKKEILSFSADIIYPLQLQKVEKKKQYEGVRLASGTVIKLYDYQIGKRFLASAFRGSREAMIENLVETVLPFRFLDFRQTRDKERKGERALGIDARPFYGMEFLLIRSHRDEDGGDGAKEALGEEPIHVDNITIPSLGVIKIRAISLKDNLPKWLKESKYRVFHVVNGQVHFKEMRGYLTNCNLPALKDRAVIIVDASGLKFSAHNMIWKGDREHIRETTFGEMYRERVTRAIKDSDALKDLQTKIARQEFAKINKVESDALFQKLVDKDSTFADLLSGKDPTISIYTSGKGDKEGEEEKYEGQYSPTFVRWKEKFRKMDSVLIPINKRRLIVAKTDVVNDYLRRTKNQGKIIFEQAIRENFERNETVKNGDLIIHLTPVPNKVQVDQVFSLKVSLKDDAMPIPVSTEEITVQITKEQKSRKRPKPEPNGPTGKKKKTLARDLPKCVLLTKDGKDIPGLDYSIQKWPSDFNENDGGFIEDLGEEKIYKINYDNVYHRKYRAQGQTQTAKDATTARYILGMRILMLGYEHALQAVGDKNGDAKEYSDEFRKLAAKGAATTVLALAENLPKIVDVASSSPEDE